MFDPLDWDWVWEVKCYINTHLCDLNMWHSQPAGKQTQYDNTLEIFTFRIIYTDLGHSRHRNNGLASQPNSI